VAVCAVSAVQAAFFLAILLSSNHYAIKNTYFQHLIAVQGCSKGKRLNRLRPGQETGLETREEFPMRLDEIRPITEESSLEWSLNSLAITDGTWKP
jgi:hypothetical protein